MVFTLILTFNTISASAQELEGTIRKSVTDQQWETSAISIEPDEEVEEILAANMNKTPKVGSSVIANRTAPSAVEIFLGVSAVICIGVIIKLSKELYDAKSYHKA